MDSIPDRPARAAAAQTPPSAAPPPAVRELALHRHLEEISLEAQDAPGKAFVGDEDVRAHAQEGDREPSAARPGREPEARPPFGTDLAEPPRGAADPERRVPRQRLVGPHGAVFRGERDRHPAPRESHQPAAAVVPNARTPARTSSMTIPRPPGRCCSRRIGPGLPDVEQAESEEGRQPGPPARRPGTDTRRTARRRRRGAAPRPHR